MRKAFVPAVFVLVSACDLPPPTPQEAAQMQKQQDELQEQQDEFELNSDCFDGNQKACDELEKLRAAEGVGDILDEDSLN